ncbi:MAG TPA: hypothetical protein VF774_00440 [Pseudoduganella sp.]|jgi:hypothetical protein
MKMTGTALFVLAVTVAWFLWPYNAGPGELQPARIQTGQAGNAGAATSR